MILPEDTPGLKEALEYNANLMRQGIWPEPWDIPSVIESEEDLKRLDDLANGALIRELAERKARDEAA